MCLVDSGLFCRCSVAIGVSGWGFSCVAGEGDGGNVREGRSCGFDFDVRVMLDFVFYLLFLIVLNLVVCMFVLFHGNPSGRNL